MPRKTYTSTARREDLEDFGELYAWLDSLDGLTPPKRGLGKDFADAFIAAEVTSLFFPR